MSILDKVNINCDYIGPTTKWDTSVYEWEVTLEYGDREWTLPYYMGFGHDTNEPKLKMVLDSLFSDALLGRMDLEEFSGTIGLDPYEDREEAERQLNECIEIDNKLNDLFGENREEIEREII